MSKITKDAFLGAMRNVGVKLVDVGEPFNCKIGIRLLTVKDREDLEMMSLQMRDSETGKVDLRGGRAQILRRCLCDEEGGLLFSGSADDLQTLEALPAKQVEILLEECKDFNGLEDDENLKRQSQKKMESDARKK